MLIWLDPSTSRPRRLPSTTKSFYCLSPHVKHSSWKYWHAAMLHGKALAIVVAYDVYKECCEGTLDPSWKAVPVDFHIFRERLAKQMLTYCPSNLKYKGDETFRVSTQIPKARRRKRSSAGVSSASSSTHPSVCSTYITSSGINREILDDAKGRVCGFLDDLLEHERACIRIPGRKHLMCQCCGKQAYFRCMLCPGQPPIHMSIPDGRTNSCFVHYHNAASLGVWRGDWKLKQQSKRRDWVYPTESSLRESSRQMERLFQSMQAERAAFVAATRTPSTPPRARMPAQFAAVVNSNKDDNNKKTTTADSNPNPIIVEHCV